MRRSAAPRGGLYKHSDAYYNMDYIGYSHILGTLSIQPLSLGGSSQVQWRYLFLLLFAVRRRRRRRSEFDTSPCKLSIVLFDLVPRL